MAVTRPAAPECSISLSLPLVLLDRAQIYAGLRRLVHPADSRCLRQTATERRHTRTACHRFGGGSGFRWRCSGPSRGGCHGEKVTYTCKYSNAGSGCCSAPVPGTPQVHPWRLARRVPRRDGLTARLQHPDPSIQTCTKRHVHAIPLRPPASPWSFTSTANAMSSRRCRRRPESKEDGGGGRWVETRAACCAAPKMGLAGEP